MKITIGSELLLRPHISFHFIHKTLKIVLTDQMITE